MKKDKIIKEFQEEFDLGEKYEYDFNKDVCGRTIEVLVPQDDAKRIRSKLPRWWRKYRTIVKYRDKLKKEDDE